MSEGRRRVNLDDSDDNYEDEFDADVASPSAAHVDKIKQLAETYKVGAEPYRHSRDDDSEEERYEEEFDANNSQIKTDINNFDFAGAAQGNGLSSKTGTHKSNNVIQKQGADKSSMDGRGSDITKQT